MYSKAKKTAQWAVSKMRSLSARTAPPMAAGDKLAAKRTETDTADKAAAKSAMAYQQGFTSGPMT